jgi:hypothetical protein
MTSAVYDIILRFFDRAIGCTSDLPTDFAVAHPDVIRLRHREHVATVLTSHVRSIRWQESQETIVRL